MQRKAENRKTEEKGGQSIKSQQGGELIKILQRLQIKVKTF